MNLLDGLKVGDKMWVIGTGEATVVKTDYNDVYPILVRVRNDALWCYTADGLFDSLDVEPTLFRVRPTITTGKVKVTRGVSTWGAVDHRNQVVAVFETMESAVIFVDGERGWYVVPLTGSYEVEVEG